ncbi:hypothetical protein IQ06DRAFT_130763 [Phaeosphaeriaceae sp. SRC1lsM3a]|nr:hypothetical protein IQ06DRAFT_130763 [Stagonospora sp. SRC1lsM3a]
MTTTARCYSCHSLRPIYEFPYRRKDTGITASSRLKRYLGVLLQKPGASTNDRRGSGGVIYRYRCIHPRAGRCPKAMAAEQARVLVSQEEVRVERELSLVRRRTLDGDGDEDGGGNEIEIEGIMEEGGEQEEFRRRKEEAREKLRQCVDAAEANGTDGEEKAKDLSV